MNKPSVPLSAQEPLFIGLSCTGTLHPAGAMGVCHVIEVAPECGVC